MRNSISLTVIFTMMIITLGRSEYCEEWQLMGVYLEGDKVCYEGQGYVADRDVCASCSPELDYYWSPTEDCDCGVVPPQNEWIPDSNNIYYDAGNVGIGKAPSPDYSLDVYGNANVKDWIYTYGLSATNTISILSGNKVAWMDYDSIYIESGSGKKTTIKPHQIDLYEAGQGLTTLRARDITTPLLTTPSLKTNFLGPNTGTIVELSGQLINTGVDGTMQILQGGLLQTGIGGAPIVVIKNGGIVCDGEIYTTTNIEAGNNITTSTLDATVLITTNEINASTIEASESIKTRAITITDEDWSDYVFKPGYNLKSLDEVQSFITKNGHLPDIPSEQAVKKNGINVGKMQVKLLAKIEEMTLYMLQMQKRINELEVKLNELQ